MDIIDIVKEQRGYYLKGNTLTYKSRMEALDLLYTSIKSNEEEVIKALELDLGKNRVEGYFSEIGQVYTELRYMKKHLKKLIKNKKVKSELSDFPSKSFTSPHPYGVTLIISPWNYPFLLTIGPLIGALAAGNTSVIKPSEFSIHTTDIIVKIISAFRQELVAVVQGGVEETSLLLDQKFDYIFFTGSGTVGKIVMGKASKHLTPVSLELGGKSPVIIDKETNIKVAAKRVAFGKYLNAGQTCIAPDYVFVHQDIKKDFLSYFEQAIKELYGGDPITSNDFGKIINERHFKRLHSLMDGGEIIIGGNVDESLLKIAPTVLDNVRLDSNVMNEEIFGPILPIIEFDDMLKVVDYINNHDKPLALYLFTNNKTVEDLVLTRCNFGGGCINDTLIQAGSHYLPFGGVGESGIGSYHGDNTFKTFSHYRSVIKKSMLLDLPVRYAPYTSKTEKMIRRILK